MKGERAETGEFLYIKNFRRYSSNTNAKLLWLLESNEAFLFQKSLGVRIDRVVAYNFRFWSYTNNEKTRFFLSGKRGELNKAEKKLKMNGEIFLEDDQGLKIYGKEILYEINKNLLTSQKPVLIQQGAIKTLCNRGVEIYIDAKNRKQTCKSPQISYQNIPGQIKTRKNRNRFFL